MAIFTGTAGADVADATPPGTLTGFGGGTLAELIDGTGDTFNAGGGADTVIGGAGGDTINGEGDNDSLIGAGGADSLVGGDGDDILRGGASNDTLVGGANGAGGDTADYSDATISFSAALDASGNATVFIAGSDSLQGIENIIGGTSNDTLTGNAVANVLQGGNGDDSLNGGGGNDVLDGGVGTGDTVTFGTTTLGVVVDLTLGSNQAVGTESGTDQLAGFENITGGSGADNLTGDGNNNILTGGAGNDTLAGGLGTDTAEYSTTTLGVVVDLSLGSNQAVGSESGTDQLSGFENVGGGSGADSITGDSLANAIDGRNGNDTLTGGDGNDTLNGNSGTDSMSGGSGNDSYLVDAGDVIVELVDDGIDSVTFSAGTYTLAANVENGAMVTNSSGNITGNALANALSGVNGAVTLTGGEGNDTLAGGNGADFLDGGLDADSISGGNNPDTIFGGDGNDTISAGNGDDSIVGGSGTDSIAGGNDNDSIDGGVEGDTISGGNGNDTLVGGDGNDSISGDINDDSIDGGIGNDTLNGGSNIDTVTYAWTTTGVVVSFSAVSNQAVGAESGTDQLSLFERVVGGSGNDSIDTSVLTVTNNTLDGGAGTDTLTGGTGDDTYIVDTFLDMIVEAASAGIDTVISSDSYISHANIENITLTGVAGNGAIGNDLANVITGNTGGNGITGGLGNDTINGGDGNDTINGNDGGDSMSGGAGNDVYFVDNALDVVVDVVENGVFDIIWTIVTMTLPENVEIIILDGGNVAINATGNDGAADNTPNLMLGNNAVNVLTTFGGDDIILGLDGNDTINTGAGSAAGVEIISGGVGADTLTSGGGHDYFTYAAIGEGGDTITDFGVAGNDLDILDLRPMFPTFTNTVGVTTVAQAVASGHLTFTQAGADTQVFADADGGGNNNVLLATLANTTAATVQLLTLI